MEARDGLKPVSLGTWPTPMEPAPRLAEALGLDASSLWIKRDDLTGLGGGGNKIRKLEWSIAAASAAGADVLVTSGAPQSNHARLTAAAAARAGIESVLVLAGTPPRGLVGNLALDALFGAHVEWTGEVPPGADADQVLQETVDEVAARLREQGRRVYVVPFGGSSAESAQGYRTAAGEILDQLPHVQHVVVAVGSGGTAAGLVAGLGPQRVLGVHTGAVSDPRGTVAGLLADMPDVHVAPASLRIREDQVGKSYDTVGAGAAQAIEMAARTEGLILDPIYTGRALAGLAAAVSDGEIAPDAPTVFVHTGGLPGFFGHLAALESVLRL